MLSIIFWCLLSVIGVWAAGTLFLLWHLRHQYDYKATALLWPILISWEIWDRLNGR